MTKKYTQKMFQTDLKKLEFFLNNNKEMSSNKSKSEGGSKNSQTRRFKMIEANKNEVNIGYVKINSDKGSPYQAAKKLFSSYCHNKDLTGNDKLKVKTTFTIQETTKDSNHKIYGPYVGSWKSLNKEEKKSASRAGIQFNMRSKVKLLKGGKKKNKQNKRNDVNEDSDEDSLYSNYDSEDEEYAKILKSNSKAGG